MSEFTCKGFTSNFSVILNFAFQISYTANALTQRESERKECSCQFFSAFRRDYPVSRKEVSFPFAKQVAWDNRRSSTCDQSTSTTLLSTGTNDIVQNDRCGRASCKAILPLYILGKTFMNIVTHAYFYCISDEAITSQKDQWIFKWFFNCTSNFFFYVKFSISKNNNNTIKKLNIAHLFHHVNIFIAIYFYY